MSNSAANSVMVYCRALARAETLSAARLTGRAVRADGKAGMVRLTLT
jgi:hypothetical protein